MQSKYEVKIVSILMKIYRLVGLDASKMLEEGYNIFQIRLLTLAGVLTAKPIIFREL